MLVLNSSLSSCGRCGSRKLQIDTEHGVSRCKSCNSYMKADPVFMELEAYKFSDQGEIKAELYLSEDVPKEVSDKFIKGLLNGED